MCSRLFLVFLMGALSFAPVPTEAAEEIGSAVGLSPSAEGSVTGMLALGKAVVRDEVVRTGANGTLEIKFRDGTHLGLAPSSSVKLDEFVYSVKKSGDQVVFRLTRGSFRFATGTLPKSAYRIETPVALIGVRGTVLSLVTDRTGMRVSVDEGSARVCARGGAGGCADIDGSQRTVGVSATGRITRLKGVVTVALGCAQSSGSSVFCIVQRADGSSGRSLVTTTAVQPERQTPRPSPNTPGPSPNTPGPLPNTPPPSPSTPRDAGHKPSECTKCDNPGNDKSAGKAGESPGPGGRGRGTRGKGDSDGKGNTASRGGN
jgi:FecR-like protein